MLPFGIWDRGFPKRAHNCCKPSNLFELVNGISGIVKAPRGLLYRKMDILRNQAGLYYHSNDRVICSRAFFTPVNKLINPNLTQY